MKSEAVIKGFYNSPIFKRDYPKIQIVTIEELLAGVKPNVPTTISPYKEAKPVSKENRKLDI